MLEAPPEEKAVNGQNDEDEAEPPEAEIFESGVFGAEVGGEAGVFRSPNDAFDVFGWWWLREQGSDDHDGHAEEPGNEGRVLIGSIGPQPIVRGKGVED